MYALRHDSKPFARLVHLMLLLGWLLSSHGIAPAICMAAAVIDGDHTVKIGVTNDGALTVVLSHAGKTAAELNSHEHDVLCRVLVAFAESPSPGASDHVLAFKPVEDSSRAPRLLLSMQGGVKTAVLVPVLNFCPVKLPSVDGAGNYVLRRPWSQGLALKSGRTVMRC